MALDEKTERLNQLLCDCQDTIGIMKINLISMLEGEYLVVI